MQRDLASTAVPSTPPASAPTTRPPRSEIGMLGWLRHNLFSSWSNTLLTLVGLYIVWKLVDGVIAWGILTAVWTGEDGKACQVEGSGACWVFIKAKFSQFVYGRYPLEERWRVVVVYAAALVGLIPLMVPDLQGKRQNAIFVALTYVAFSVLFRGLPEIALPFALLAAVATVGVLLLRYLGRAWSTGFTFLIFPVIAFWLLTGSGYPGAGILDGVGFFAGIVGLAIVLFGRPSLRLVGALALVVAMPLIARWLFSTSGLLRLAPVPTELWGGLLVTLVVASVGITGSFPVGIALALGRRSKMPFVRWASVGFIEFVRGVPLITVLFMASVMLPLFLPTGFTIDKLLRALVGVALFAGAYMAETIRGGLQAIPRGQFEAAEALGLSYPQRMALIILPQALKLVIPGIVNSFVGLFKDTSLVLIIGLFDLLGIAQLVLTDAKWFASTTAMTAYVFAGFIFWAFCFGMSRYSQMIERRLATGHERTGPRAG
jgi:general L-amino acid transport system permease protein